MRTDHFAHLVSRAAPVVPGPSPVASGIKKQGGTQSSPVSPAVPGKKHSDPKQQPVEQTRAGLREALANACKGLPLTLAEFTEAFGEEGESDWTEGYGPHCTDDYLRAFALAVDERLGREPKNPPPVNPLDDLPLLPNDRAFIRKRTRYRDNEGELITGYQQQWIRAASGEPVSFRKANVGRRAANSWLLDQTSQKREQPQRSIAT